MSSFKIYNASAGSGKTYQIAYLFEKKILKFPSPFAFQEIMAITFTNKAVYEMKNRILEDLKSYTKDNPDGKSTDKRQKLALDLNLSIDEVQKRAKRVLHQIYDNYAGYQVTTIDSLTHRIVRTFARDLQFNASFDIELEVDEIFEEAVEIIIEEVKDDQQIKKVITEYIDYQTDEGKSWNIKSKLIDLAKVLIDENHSQAIAQLSTFSTTDFLLLKKELKQKNQKIKNSISEYADQFFELLKNNDLEPKNFTRKSLPNFLGRKKNGVMSLDVIPKYISEIEDRDPYNKSEKKDIKAKIDELKPEFVRIVNQVLQLNLDYILYDKIISQLSQLALLQVIYNHTESIKESRNCLFINDFNKRINQEIKKQPAPFIYERLGEKFNDFFIDEFQDTSHLQWENLTPLVDNALSRLKDGKPGSLTLVGDVKQSIYAWRGGDPEIFLRLIKGNSPFPVSAENKVLKNNFRSHKDIVEFNNDLFTYLSENQPYKDINEIYKEVKQIPIKSESGYIEIDFQHDKDEYPYPEMVLDKIRLILQKEAGNDSFTKSDICVLVRSNKESKAIAELLEAEDISVITATDLLIQKDSSVQVIYHLLRLFYEVDNEEDKLRIIENYQQIKNTQNIEVESLKAMIKMKPNSFIDAFNDAFNTALQPNEIFRFSLYQQVEYLVDLLGFDIDFNIYLSSFLEEVFTYNENENADTKGFLKYWENYKEKRSVSTSILDNSVNLMTIHKSKGLEFSHVIIPGLDSKIDDINKKKYWQEIPNVRSEIPFSLMTQPGKILLEHSSSHNHLQKLYEQSVLENLNLLYVSCTRASKSLFLLSEKVKNSKNHQLVMNRLLFDFVNSKGYSQSEELVFQTGKWPKHPSNPPEEAIENTFPIAMRANIDQLENRMVLDHQIDEYALEKGKLLHELMADIYTSGDFEKVNDRLENKAHLPEEMKNEVNSALKNIIYNDELSDYFSDNWRIYNEKEICYDHEILRPDRLCVKGNQAVIIDYKTGNERPEDQEQIENYAKAVEEMNYQIFGKFLIYINEKIAVKNV